MYKHILHYRINLGALKKIPVKELKTIEPTLNRFKTKKEIIVIYVSSFVSVFQFDNEANFNDIFKKCEINNANPYAYTNKFRNLPFWNITSAYIKYNYKNF